MPAGGTAAWLHQGQRTKFLHIRFACQGHSQALRRDGAGFPGFGYTLKTMWLLGWGQQREEIWCWGYILGPQQVTQSLEAEVPPKVTHL